MIRVRPIIVDEEGVRIWRCPACDDHLEQPEDSRGEPSYCPTCETDEWYRCGLGGCVVTRDLLRPVTWTVRTIYACAQCRADQGAYAACLRGQPEET